MNLLKEKTYYKLLSFFSPILNSPAEGALPILMATTDPLVKGGDYYGPKGMREMRHSSQKVKIIDDSATYSFPNTT